MFANVPHSEDEKRGNQSEIPSNEIVQFFTAVESEQIYKFTVKGQRTLERTQNTQQTHRLLHLIASNYSLHSRVCPSALQIPCNLFQAVSLSTNLMN